MAKAWASEVWQEHRGWWARVWFDGERSVTAWAKTKTDALIAAFDRAREEADRG